MVWRGSGVIHSTITYTAFRGRYICRSNASPSSEMFASLPIYIVRKPPRRRELFWASADVDDPTLYMALEAKHYPRRYTFSSTSPTTAGSSVMGAIDAPIHRLPAEILVHIFALHSDAFAPAFKVPFPAASKRPYEFDPELDRLANVHLLTLSRVCGEWHHIVLDTAALWSTFNLNGVLWSSPYYLEKTMTLLAAGLERTRNVLLEVRIFDETVIPLPPRVFALLAQHSHRWRTAEFRCSTEDIDLSMLKGRLPVLQRLKIDVRHMSHTIDFFEGAPRLETLIVRGMLLGKIGTIPYNLVSLDRRFSGSNSYLAH
ncbi:hypothetical protein C8J57DRAFT_461760 [Mycena rebaudengoi]|nr:hypothetical protein C8J57DRAFT_461760 [Mycena rebaudengoi]